MGAKSIYCVSIVYNFFAGCTTVAQNIQMERRPATQNIRGMISIPDEFSPPVAL
jgi:hypothetical protein